MRSLSIVVVCLTFAGAIPLRAERPGAQAADSAGDGAPMLLGTTCIATGPDDTVDGFLEICPDDYGAWADTTFGGGGDRFNPSGPEPARPTTFTSGFFIFNAAGTQRELLSDSADWQGVFAADASMSRAVTVSLFAQDSAPVDGVADTLLSRFVVSGGAGVQLDVSLGQHVERILPGVAKMEQIYFINNLSDIPVEIVLVRAADLDLVFNGTAFDDDSVGTTWNTAGGDRYVVQQEAGDPRTAVTLTSSSASVHYGGKNGIDPDGGGVPFNFGTDTDIWDAYGVPDGSGGFDGSDWRNHIAGVGYNTDGFSGAAPAGCAAPCDGFIGLEIPLSLAANETVRVEIVHWFGPPVSACCMPNGECGDLPVNDCTRFGSTPQGLGTECASTTCVVDYELAIDGPATVNGAPGSTVEFEATVDLSINAAAGFVQGLSFGIAHSGPGTCTITGLVEGAGSAATNGGDGADFFAESFPAGGATIGLVVSLIGQDSFDPGATYEVAKLTIEATIPADGCVTCELSFTDTLGSPAVNTIVVVGGASFPPAQTNQATSLCSAAQACCFPTGACGEIDTPEDCVSFGGTPQGVDSECATTSCSTCPEDLDGNGEVRVPDLIQMLGAWGDCPPAP